MRWIYRCAIVTARCWVEILFVNIYWRDRRIDELHQSLTKVKTDTMVKDRNKVCFISRNLSGLISHMSAECLKLCITYFPNSTQSCRVFCLHQFFNCLHTCNRAPRLFVISMGDHTVQAHLGKSHTICYCCRGFRFRVYAKVALFWNGHSCCCGGSSSMNNWSQYFII